MDDLKLQMLSAVRAGDRAWGERIRALQMEEETKRHLEVIKMINSSFYRVWCDWKAHEAHAEEESIL